MATHGELMDAAVAETGLDAFGDDSFREGLEILVRALGDGGPPQRGRRGLHLPADHRVPRQRLQVEDWYRRHPEIGDERIDAPLIGLSLPRTGSTALSFLLAQDPDIRYLHMWESPALPAAVDGRPATRSPALPEGWNNQQKIGHAPTHVPADIQGPLECLELLALDFKSQMFLAFAQLPSYADWLLDADLTSTYRYERRVLKLLQWGAAARGRGG